MIFELSVNEITFLIGAFIIIGIIFILLIIVVIYLFISDKLHDKYHEGYNDAKDDKIKYYSTINSLRDNFEKIISNLKIDNLKPSIITTDLILKYRDSLDEYYNN